MAGTFSTARDYVGLHDRTGEQVVSVELPKFNPPAEVVKWGSRHFVLVGLANRKGGLKYVEAMCFEVVQERKEGTNQPV